MGLFDEIAGIAKDLALVKNEVTQNVTEVKDTLTDTKDQIAGQTSGVGEAISDAAGEPAIKPVDELTGK